MRVALVGLWHLGCVTAACLADHFDVAGYDPDAENIERLRSGRAPISEPGLDAQLASGMRSGRLRFTNDARDALENADVVWITFDTPVDDDDRPDVEAVVSRVEELFHFIPAGAVVLISSQIPVGTTRRLASMFQRIRTDANVTFAYSPENLRLGQAIEVFRNPGRIVIGIDGPVPERLEVLCRPFGPILPMQIESAEMAKHSLNAFLAVSVSFINEIARLCEAVGADVKAVESALRSDSRIGKTAYLSPGLGYAGGTLARDIVTLNAVAEREQVATQMLAATRTSNQLQQCWAERKLTEVLHDLGGVRVTVLGLTYKPGTDTLRRSTAVGLCRSLLQAGAVITAYDPVISSLPPNLAQVRLASNAGDALDKADAAVIATEWPEFRRLGMEHFRRMTTMRLFDPKSVIAEDVSSAVSYYAIGRTVNRDMAAGRR